MKIVIFAHVPPPHHGQSAMVKLMLDGLESGEFGEFEIHHIDARFSTSLEDVGTSGISKGFLALKFAFQAIRCRLIHGVKAIYYVPAPPKASAMIRDWIVLALCRPFFPQLIFHWHAVGLGQWTIASAQSQNLKSRVMAKLNRLIMSRHAVSLSLTRWGTRDSDVFSPRRNFIVPNGISDPCSDFDDSLLSTRKARREELKAPMVMTTYRVAFLGHCHEGKGLWDTMHAIALANRKLEDGNQLIRLELTVAGEFPSSDDHNYFDSLRDELGPAQFEYIGFVAGEDKRDFLEGADCLCFPTKYEAESFGLVAAEALAFGIPPVCSDWRMLPDLMKMVGLPVAETGNPDSLARQLVVSIGRDSPEFLRAAFCDNFTERKHLQILTDSLREATGLSER
ncbi:glycosyltransferase [bacterium]|nr:glycosyltransferase [bacterium]MDB4318013.1 glycosyltransferase [bacterium]MDB4414131.1 glycosyltransferase [Akkermansiaceae bacterium]MDB4596933.1 glycosyltransferase [Akkermansiaceae bacterium]MDB4611064.1 glycosyltransferase [Akkermansiaceae bacterium]